MPGEHAIEVLSEAVLRAAAWPIDTVEQFAAPGLAQLARSWGLAARAIDQRRFEAAAQLGEMVPHISDQTLRRYVLDVRRRIHAGVDMLPSLPVVIEDSALAALLKAEVSDRRALGDARVAFERAYAAEAARQRQTLREATGDARFCCALAVANPEVELRWTRSAGRAPDKARHRRLETTVFCYLMRAAGRATPHGCWSGVAPVSLRIDGRQKGAMIVRPGRRRHVVNPDLLAFIQIVDAIGRRSIPSTTGGHLPAAPDAWSALEAVTAQLDEADGYVWVAAVGEMRAICEGLASHLDADHVEGVRATIRALTATRDRLLRWAGLEPSDSQPVVRVDLRLPFDATWDRPLVAACGRALGHTLAYYSRDGIPELFRRASLADIKAASNRHGIVPLALAAKALRPRERAPAQLRDTHEGAFWAFRAMAGLWPEVVARVERGQRRLAGAWMDESLVSCLDLAMPRLAGPAGAWLITLAGPDSLRMDWGRPQPGMFARRYAEVLRPDHGEAPVIDALRELFGRWLQQGITAVEVVGADAPNPNAALGPRLTAEVLDAHDRGALIEMTVELDAMARPWLWHAKDGDRRVAVYNSAAWIGVRDPDSRLLFRIAMGHGWEFLSGGFLTLPEERTRHHLPRIVLPDGTAIVGQRWTITASQLAELRTAAPAAQYLAWTAMVDGLGLPGLVWARLETHPDAPCLLFRTDSPLALRCVLERVPPMVDRVVLIECPGDPANWPVRDHDGRPYLAQLAVTWHDMGYWGRAAGASAGT